MKSAELRGKTDDELKALLLEQKKEAFNLRFQKTSGELENTARIREVRKTVARIKTLLNNPAALEAKPASKPAKKAATKKADAAPKKKAPAKKAATKKKTA